MMNPWNENPYFAPTWDLYLPSHTFALSLVHQADQPLSNYPNLINTFLDKSGMRSILTGKFKIEENGSFAEINNEGIGTICFQNDDYKSIQIIIGLSGRAALMFLSTRDTYDFSTKSTRNKLIWNSNHLRTSTGEVISLTMNRIE